MLIRQGVYFFFVVLFFQTFVAVSQVRIFQRISVVKPARYLGNRVYEWWWYESPAMKDGAQADWIRSEVLVSISTVLCAIIVYSLAFIFFVWPISRPLSPMVSCLLVRLVLTGPHRSVWVTHLFTTPRGSCHTLTASTSGLDSHESSTIAGECPRGGRVQLTTNVEIGSCSSSC